MMRAMSHILSNGEVIAREQRKEQRGKVMKK